MSIFIYNMNITPLKDYIKYSKRKISNVLNNADKHDLASEKYNNYIHCASHILKHKYKSDIAIIQTHISLYELFNEYLKSDCKYNHLLNMWCGFYKNNNDTPTYYEEHFYSKINNLMIANKTIYILLDLHEYLLYETDEDETIHETIHHATALILYKDTNNCYRAFYFNSHGGNILKEKSYNLYITRKRKKNITLNMPVDMFIINNLINTYNSNIANYVDNYSKINYEMNADFNYIGPNFQIGDHYGVCYIYPFVILHYLLHEFNNINYLHNDDSGYMRRLPSYSTLLKNNKLNNMILIMMSKIYKNLKSEFLIYYINSDISDLTNLNIVINYQFEKNNTLYIKYLYCIILEFLLQTALVNRVNSILYSQEI